jgi:hypothetical protein
MARFSNDVQPWTPESFSSPQRAHAFLHLRDLPLPERGTLRALNEHRIRCLKKPAVGAVPGRWKVWSTEDDWVGRLQAWDAHVDAERRSAFLREQREAVARHVRAAQAAISTALVLPRAVLTRLSKPEFTAELEKAAALPLLRDALRGLVVLPSLVNVERLSLGLSTGEIAIDDRRADLERERAVADAIAADPRLVDLAVELLDGIAKPPGQ